MGRQETADWNDPISNLTDRLTTLENYPAQILGSLNVMDAKIETLLFQLQKTFHSTRSTSRSVFTV